MIPLRPVAVPRHGRALPGPSPSGRVDCPDWPVAASGPAGVTPDAPLAVMAANRVVAASRAAREEQVVPGLRRRAAQALLPIPGPDPLGSRA